MSDDLKTLFPDFRAQLRAGEIECNPFGLEQFAQVGAILKKYGSLVASVQGDVRLADLALKLLGEGGEVAADCLKLISLSTGLSVADLGKLRGDEQFALLEKVLEANLDFFLRRIGPAIRQAMALFGFSAGAPSLPASSDSAGAGQTSAA